MSNRALVRRVAAVAAALACSLGLAGAASADAPPYLDLGYATGGVSSGRVVACVQTGVAPGAGYRDMGVRFRALEGRDPIPTRVAVAHGPGYRDSWVRLPQERPTKPGSGYRDTFARFNGLSSGPNAIATARCYYSF